LLTTAAAVVAAADATTIADATADAVAHNHLRHKNIAEKESRRGLFFYSESCSEKRRKSI